MALRQKSCSHISQLLSVQVGEGRQCEECIKTGSRWVHLRTCQECGKTICCDSSPKKHATQHFKKDQHPVVASAETGEYWLWCFADRVFQEYDTNLRPS